MPVWPTILPQAPAKDGFSDACPSNLLRSDMDSGPAKVRRRGSAKPRTVSCTYVFSDVEADAFEEFVNNTLYDGSICFDWWHPVLARYVRARLVPQSDSLYSREYFNSSLSWQYALTLEYWPDAPLEG